MRYDTSVAREVSETVCVCKVAVVIRTSYLTSKHSTWHKMKVNPLSTAKTLYQPQSCTTIDNQPYYIPSSPLQTECISAVRFTQPSQLSIQYIMSLWSTALTSWLLIFLQLLHNHWDEIAYVHSENDKCIEYYFQTWIRDMLHKFQRAFQLKANRWVQWICRQQRMLFLWVCEIGRKNNTF